MGYVKLAVCINQIIARSLRKELRNPRNVPISGGVECEPNIHGERFGTMSPATMVC